MAVSFEGDETTITLDDVKIVVRQIYRDDQAIVDIIDLMESTMLKQLPPEHIYGVLNLFYALHGNGTEKEIEDALV